jgi:hypothetical protein
MLTLYIIVARTKEGRVIQTYEREGKESALDCISELMDNPTWRITVREA